MQFPGAHIIGKNGREWIAIYNFQHDVYVNPSLKHNLKHVMHSSYSRGNKKGSVDYFILPKGVNAKDVLSWKKTIVLKDNKAVIDGIRLEKIKPTEIEGVTKSLKTGKITKSDLRNAQKDLAKKLKRKYVEFHAEISQGDLRCANKQYDIQREMIALPSALEKELFMADRADIAEYCGDNPAKKPRGTKTTIVDKIIPKTEIKYMIPANMITGGKQWTVKECKLEGNWDGGKGCLTGFIPGPEGGRFDGTFFYNCFSIPTAECNYCYSYRQHKSFPKSIHKPDKPRLKEEMLGAATLDFEREIPLGKVLDILRMGKRIEPWTPFTQEGFIDCLEVCAELGTRPVITTKFLPFMPEYINLFRQSNPAILYAIGYDEFERGACAWGRTNKWRIEQALKWREVGIDSWFYLLIADANAEITPREKEILHISDFGRKIPIQLLPITYKKSEVFKNMTERDWYEVRVTGRNKDVGVFDFADPPYETEQKALRVRRIHNDYLGLINDNKGRIRMCHHNTDFVYCGGCSHYPGAIYDLNNKYMKN
jgi:hypothetical protein